MENSTIKINLSAFVHIVTTVKNKAGNPVKGIFIPLEKNNIFEGKKGLYVDLIAFPIKNNKTDSKDTHLIKQSISKEEREKNDPGAAEQPAHHRQYDRLELCKTVRQRRSRPAA